MEKWESVEDSDDSSSSLVLLRPCTTTTTTTININRQSNSNHNNYSFSNLNNNNNNNNNSSPILNNLIPGPAGQLQAKMYPINTQINHHYNNNYNNNNDYEEERESEEFNLGPWLSAIHFVTQSGTRAIPLSSVTKSRDIGRIDLVVAVITSCTPNGLGDVMVTLKDPTGTIAASIHRKVFADGEFGKEIFVGSVLILQKVAVFCPSRSAIYLNITQSNVAKVISKDSGPPTKQNTFISAVRPASGCHKETSVNVKSLDSMEVQMTGELCDGSEQCDKTGKENNANSFSKSDQTITSADQIMKKVCRKNSMGDEQRGPNASARLDKHLNSEVIMTMPCVQREKQPVPTVIASLPEWTDEQLNELFTADYEDIGSFL